MAHYCAAVGNRAMSQPPKARLVLADIDSTLVTKEKRLTKEAKAQAAVEADQQIVLRLTRQLAGARQSQQDILEDQIEVAKAQLELDQDELDTASNDLAKAGGDPQAKIKRLKDAHEAADRESSQAMTAARPAPVFQAGSLVGRILEWQAQRAKSARLDQARLEAQTKGQALVKRRAEIEANCGDGQKRQYQQQENRRGVSS